MQSPLNRPECPSCGHYTMYPLKGFYEDDVHDNPMSSGSSLGQWGRFVPGFAVLFMIFTTIGAAVWGKKRQSEGKEKVRIARQTILPRSPKSLICPSCYEVLERI